MKYRKPIRHLIRCLSKKDDFDTRLMVQSVRNMLNALPKSLPSLDQVAYHSYDTKAAVIWSCLVRKRFKHRKRRTPAAEQNLAVYVLTVAMSAHLAATEITTSIPSYIQGQVAQAINRATFSIRPLQSKSVARRLYAVIGPLYRHWLEAHTKEIVTEATRVH
jgi:hypothetical protein